MGKAKKARGESKKKVRDLKAKELDGASARSVAGGKATFQDINFTHTVDKASPSLS
jgi:hypothetical protein